MIRIQITETPPGGNFCSGADYIQVRNHGASARELAYLVRAAMKTAPVLVNDRIDVAIACGANGVHLRSGSIAPYVVKRLAGLIVSVACHNALDVERAEAEGADFAVLAPVFSPLSKRDERPPLGIDELKRVCAARKISVIALGGITAANTIQCIEAGAAGIAGITLFRQWPA